MEGGTIKQKCTKVISDSNTKKLKQGNGIASDWAGWGIRRCHSEETALNDDKDPAIRRAF